jgi:hypothetical protein
MRANVKDLDITVACLDDEMDWAIWDNDDSTVFPDYSRK